MSVHAHSGAESNCVCVCAVQCRVIVHNKCAFEQGKEGKNFKKNAMRKNGKMRKEKTIEKLGRQEKKKQENVNN